MWGILLPPIIAGYFYITRSRFTKHRIEFLDQQRVLFESVLWGLYGLGIALVLGVLLPLACGLDPQFYNQRLALPDFTLQSIAGGLILIVAGLFSRPKAQNPTGEIDPYLVRAIREVGDELDNLLLTAYTTDSSLLITLDSGKVYVVKVHSTPRPRQTKYVEFVPLLSGYRTPTQTVEFNTDYVESARRHPESKFRIVIELKDITSLQPWDPKIYEAEFMRNRDAA